MSVMNCGWKEGAIVSGIKTVIRLRNIILMTSTADNLRQARGPRVIGRCVPIGAGDLLDRLSTHRLCAIRDANQVLVVNGGEIVERGTHQSLLD